MSKPNWTIAELGKQLQASGYKPLELLERHGDRIESLRDAWRASVERATTNGVTTLLRSQAKCPHRSDDYPDLACMHEAGHEGACRSGEGWSWWPQCPNVCPSHLMVRGQRCAERAGHEGQCRAVRPDGVESLWGAAAGAEVIKAVEQVYATHGAPSEPERTEPSANPSAKPTPPTTETIVVDLTPMLRRIGALARQHYEQHREVRRRAISRLLASDTGPFTTARRAAVLAYCERLTPPPRQVELLLEALTRYEAARGVGRVPEPQAQWELAGLKGMEAVDAALAAYERARGCR